MLEDGEGDHLVKNEAEMVADTHVADGHEVGFDHAEPFVDRGRFADHAPAAQSIMSILQRGGVSTWTSTSEQSKCAVARLRGRLTSGLKRGTALIMLVQGQAVETAVSAERRRAPFLRFVVTTSNPPV